MVTLAEALQTAAETLYPSSNARLDAEVLLAKTLHVPRSHFYAWPDQLLSAADAEIFAALIARKKAGEPVAYLTGWREFWSREFKVSTDTLIPRPETELLLEVLFRLFPSPTAALSIADIGTGSGVLAITCALERPHWQVTATDVSTAALTMAATNAELYQVKTVSFRAGHWCKALPSIQYDAIISNPPYIAKDDSELNQDVIESEPHLALFADEAGLQALKEIILTAKSYLKSDGYLLVEHGHRQAKPVAALMAAAGYTHIQLFKDLADKDRVTVGCFSASIVS